MAVFDYPRQITDQEIEGIQRFREQPIQPRDRAFGAFAPSEIEPAGTIYSTRERLGENEGVVKKRDFVQPVSLSLLRRIALNSAFSKHADGAALLPGLSHEASNIEDI